MQLDVLAEEMLIAHPARVYHPHAHPRFFVLLAAQSAATKAAGYIIALTRAEGPLSHLSAAEAVPSC